MPPKKDTHIQLTVWFDRATYEWLKVHHLIPNGIPFSQWARQQLMQTIQYMQEIQG